MVWQTSSLEPFQQYKVGEYEKWWCNSLIFKNIYLSPCRPPLLRLTSTRRGCVPGRGVILKSRKGEKVTNTHTYARCTDLLSQSVSGEDLPAVPDHHWWTWNTGRCPQGWYWGMILLHLFWQQNDGPTDIQTLQWTSTNRNRVRQMCIWDKNDKTNAISESVSLY